MLNFVPTAAAVQLPLHLHLRPSGFRKKSCDACFAEGIGGERENIVVRFRDIHGSFNGVFYMYMCMLGLVQFCYQDVE